MWMMTRTATGLCTCMLATQKRGRELSVNFFLSVNYLTLHGGCLLLARLTKEDLTEKLTNKMAGDICATVVQERRRKESVKQQKHEREQLMQRVAELKQRRQVR